MTTPENGAKKPDTPEPPSARPARDPQLIPGWHQVSMAALQERIEAQMLAESPPDLFLATASDSERRELLREAAHYVMELEAIRLPRAELMALLERLYANLFQFGPLDPYLTDPDITELTIDGPNTVYIRRGMDGMEATPAYFDDSDHLRGIVTRILSQTGAVLSEEAPFVEVGVVLFGRPARITAAAPPVSIQYHVNLRLHPAASLSLAALVGCDMLSALASQTLQAALDSRRGVMIVGDVGTGKTTLLNALVSPLPGGALVERSAELRPPATFSRWAGQDFGAQIEAALLEQPTCLVLDEVRFDEMAALLAALRTQPPLHCLWAFRGAVEPGRLRASFGMSIRRAEPAIDQAEINNFLVQQLPVVATLARHDGAIRVTTIGEWALAGDSVELNRLPT